jgi:DNA invertase Pin-like site-specific DNA recombinase
MKVFYTRVSTIDQKMDRQMNELEGFDYVFSDYCSGSIDLWERPKGSQIKKLIENNSLTHLEVHSIDRLGRNTLSVLQVWKELTDLGIKLVCRNPKFPKYQ